MTTHRDSEQARTSDDTRAWIRWSKEQAPLLEEATSAQRALLEAGVRFVAITGGSMLMRRLVGFVLLHTGMGLTPRQVGAALERTDRAMRNVRALTAEAFVDSVWNELGRHRKPKLSPSHTGPIIQYMLGHPRCTQREMIGFIHETFDILVDPLTLRRFFKKYNLGILREDQRKKTQEAGAAGNPFDLDEPASAGPSSSCRRRSR